MIKLLTIKSHGATITVPSEILVLEAKGLITSNTHLVLDKTLWFDKEYFSIIRINGIYVYDRMLSAQAINTMEYRACTTETYYKLRAFL